MDHHRAAGCHGWRGRPRVLAASASPPNGDRRASSTADGPAQVGSGFPIRAGGTHDRPCLERHGPFPGSPARARRQSATDPRNGCQDAPAWFASVVPPGTTKSRRATDGRRVARPGWEPATTCGPQSRVGRAPSGASAQAWLLNLLTAASRERMDIAEDGSVARHARRGHWSLDGRARTREPLRRPTCEEAHLR